MEKMPEVLGKGQQEPVFLFRDDYILKLMVSLVTLGRVIVFGVPYTTLRWLGTALDSSGRPGSSIYSGSYDSLRGLTATWKNCAGRLSRIILLRGLQNRFRPRQGKRSHGTLRVLCMMAIKVRSMSRPSVRMWLQFCSTCDCKVITCVHGRVTSLWLSSLLACGRGLSTGERSRR
jgi:hypothetical protein